MSETVEVKVRDNGPLKITGHVRVVDADGNLIRETDEGQAIALCRCGHSTDKPFCDGKHSGEGFESCVRADA
ncbi:MAG: CDGSH iron-sulfur domain-containing protein [Actinomycetes bacterium]